MRIQENNNNAMQNVMDYRESEKRLEPDASMSTLSVTISPLFHPRTLRTPHQLEYGNSGVLRRTWCEYCNPFGSQQSHIHIIQQLSSKRRFFGSTHTTWPHDDVICAHAQPQLRIGWRGCALHLEPVWNNFISAEIVRQFGRLFLSVRQNTEINTKFTLAKG